MNDAMVRVIVVTILTTVLYYLAYGSEHVVFFGLVSLGTLSFFSLLNRH